MNDSHMIHPHCEISKVYAFLCIFVFQTLLYQVRVSDSNPLLA